MRSNGNIELGERTSTVTEKEGGSQEDFTEEIAFELHNEGLVEEEWEATGSDF